MPPSPAGEEHARFHLPLNPGGQCERATMIEDDAQHGQSPGVEGQLCNATLNTPR